MDTAKLELAAQRYREAEEALEGARLDLQTEALAILSQDDAQHGGQAAVARVTGWSREYLLRLLENAPGAPRR
ncbi:hypothetical protein ACIRF8_11965 [Streptomyces sp. NPDC102406]|uniref:hypothetical protein n=1 Tax=Streptomyces sp. NPDC102406 TaxID=3366171 RepID=UPI00380FB400